MSLFAETEVKYLLENSFRWEDIAVLEDYATRAKQKYSAQTLDWAKDMAVKRLSQEKDKVRLQAIKNARMAAKLEQAKLNGMGSDYQQGVWAPFNGKIYHDRSRMVADAKALGLEETGGSTDMEYMQKKSARIKHERRQKAKQERIESIRQAIAHLKQKR